MDLLTSICVRWSVHRVWSLNMISDSRGVSFIEVEESVKPFAATDGSRLVGRTGRCEDRAQECVVSLQKVASPDLVCVVS